MQKQSTKTAIKQKIAVLLAATLLLSVLSPFSVTPVRADGPYTHAISVFAVDSVAIGRNAVQENRTGSQLFVRTDHGANNTETGWSSTHGYIKFDLAGRGINFDNVQSVELGLTNDRVQPFGTPGGLHTAPPTPTRPLRIMGVADAAWVRQGIGQIDKVNAPITQGLPLTIASIDLPRPGVTCLGHAEIHQPNGSVITHDITDFVLDRVGDGAAAFSIGLVAMAVPDPDNDSGYDTGFHRVNNHFSFAGHAIPGGTAPRLYITLDGLTAVEVVGFATTATTMEAALQTINAFADVTGWDTVNNDVGMRTNVLLNMLAASFVDRDDIVAQLQQFIDDEITAGLIPGLVRQINSATTIGPRAADPGPPVVTAHRGMLAILIDPDLGLDLAVFNTLTQDEQNFVAQLMINNRPPLGYRNITVVTEMFESVVATVVAAAGGVLRLAELDGTGGIRVIEMNVSVDGPGIVSIRDADSNEIFSHNFDTVAGQHMIAYVNLPVGTYSLYVDGLLVGRDMPFVDSAANMLGSIYVTPGVLVSGVHIAANTARAGSGGDYYFQSTNTRDNADRFVVLFDLVTDAADPDAVFSFGDSTSMTHQGAFGTTQFAMRVGGAGQTWFNVIDSRNPAGGVFGGGAWFMPGDGATPFAVIPNETFYGQMEINLDGWEFDFWMAQQGDATTQFASRGGVNVSMWPREWGLINSGARSADRVDAVRALGGTVGGITHNAVMSNMLVLEAGLVADALELLNNNLGSNAAFVPALNQIGLGINQELFARVTDLAVRDQILDNVRAAGPFDTAICVQSALNGYVISIGATQEPYWPAGANLQITMGVLQQAALTWEPGTDAFGVRGYHVYRSSAGAGGPFERIATVFGADNTGFADNNISAGATYWYRVHIFNYGDVLSAHSNIATGTALDAADFIHDRYALTDAMRQQPVRFHSVVPVGVYPPPDRGGIRATHPITGEPLWMQAEWFSPDTPMAQAMRYLTIVATDPATHNFVGPDGVTTLIERVLQHFRSMLAGGNEPGVSGTGLGAHGYIPALTALAYARVHLQDSVWNQLSPEEQERADLLMQGALFGIYYAAADTGAGRGLNQDTNYQRGWNVNHRMGLLAVPLIYYYFSVCPVASNFNDPWFTGPAGQGTAGFMNNFIRTFNYTQFTNQLQETGMTMLYNTFQNSGLTRTHRYAERIGQIGMTYNLQGRSATLGPDPIGAWSMLYLDLSFDSFPVVPTPGDIQRTGGRGGLFGEGEVPGAQDMPLQRWPADGSGPGGFIYRYPNPTIATTEVSSARYGPRAVVGFHHGYWSTWRETAGDLGVPLMEQPLWQFMGAYALNHFPNLGAPGMGQEFDATDASGVRTCIAYVVEGFFGGLDGLLGLMLVSPDRGGFEDAFFYELVVRTNVSVVDLQFRIDNEFVCFCHGRQCNISTSAPWVPRSSTRFMGGAGARMNLDLWHNLINNPVAQISAVNNAADTAVMRASLEDPSLALILHAYDGLQTELSKDNVADAMLALVPFSGKAELQTAFSLAVTEEAIRELNEATTAAQMQAALESSALGLWLFGWNQITPRIPGVTDPAQRLAYAGRVLDIWNGAEVSEHVGVGPWTTRQEIRFALASVLYYSVDILAAVNAAGDANDIDAMRSAIMEPNLELNLSRFVLLTDEMQDAVLQYVIDYIVENGHFEEVEHLQEVIDRAVAEFISEYVRRVYQDAIIADGSDARRNQNIYTDVAWMRPILRTRTHGGAGTYATLLQFNLEDLDFDPDNVAMVELNLYMQEFSMPGALAPHILAVAGQHTTTGLRASNSSWAYDTVTWNNVPGFAFNVPNRAWYWGLDRLAHPAGGNTAPGVTIDRLIFGSQASTVDDFINRWYTFDVTPAVMEAIELGEEYITLLVFEGTLNFATDRAAYARRESIATFRSSRHAQAATYDPRLNFLFFDEDEAPEPPPVFTVEIFNNGPGGTQYPRPNASLAEAGLIRMWPQLDGAEALIYYAAARTIVALDQDGECAMDFVHVGRLWCDTDGWLNYFMAIDINKNGDWEYINFEITAYDQPVNMLLVNALFEEPADDITVTFVVEAGAVGVYAAVTSYVDLLAGEEIPADAIPETAARTGFYFAGWEPSDPAEFGLVTEDVTFTARFNPLFHYVTFEAGHGGELMPTDFGLVVRIRDGFTFWEDRVPTPVANNGYEFVEWTPYNPAGFIVRENMTFTAIFAPVDATPVEPKIVSVTPVIVVIEQGGTVEITVTTQGMPDGAWVDLNVSWRDGLSIVGGPRFYIENNQATITIAADANVRLGRDGFAVAARVAGDWGSVVIIDSYTFVIEVQ